MWKLLKENIILVYGKLDMIVPSPPLLHLRDERQDFLFGLLFGKNDWFLSGIFIIIVFYTKLIKKGN